MCQKSKQIIVISGARVGEGVYEKMVSEMKALDAFSAKFSDGSADIVKAFERVGKAMSKASDQFLDVSVLERRYMAVWPEIKLAKPVVWYRAFEKKQRPRNSRRTGFR